MENNRSEGIRRKTRVNIKPSGFLRFSIPPNLLLHKETSRTSVQGPTQILASETQNLNLEIPLVFTVLFFLVSITKISNKLIGDPITKSLYINFLRDRTQIRISVLFKTKKPSRTTTNNKTPPYISFNITRCIFQTSSCFYCIPWLWASRPILSPPLPRSRLSQSYNHAVKRGHMRR